MEQFKNLAEMREQIKKCEFRDRIGHPIEKNVGFIELVELAKIGEETKGRDEYICRECESEISEQEYKDGGLCESCARLLS